MVTLLHRHFRPFENTKFGFSDLDYPYIYENEEHIFNGTENAEPKFGEDAQKMLKTKNTFVVFDLLKIMSMPSDDIKISKTWGFTFTENAENPVLVEFDNFDGTKKVSSSSLLMALYLQQHLNAIKAEIGEKPTEVAFLLSIKS